MIKKALIALALLALPVSAVAQTGDEPEMSADEMACALSGDCDAFNQDGATAETEETRGMPGIKVYLPSTVPATSKPKRPPEGGGYTKPKSASGPAVTRTRLIPRPAMAQPGRVSPPIGFASGSATFTDSGLSQAYKLLDAITRPSSADKRFVIAGHTDSIGSYESNLDLSQRRADALVQFLVDNGVDPARLESRGFGPDKPLPGLTPRHPANRRVEIEAIRDVAATK